jgi:hypothetical protein
VTNRAWGGKAGYGSAGVGDCRLTGGGLALRPDAVCFPRGRLSDDHALSGDRPPTA